MGAYVAQELKLTKTLFLTSVRASEAQDLRWGRTYESYSSDPEIVTDLALAFMEGPTKRRHTRNRPNITRRATAGLGIWHG